MVPPTKGVDPPAKPSSLVEVLEHTTTLTLTLEHQAEVHSADTIVEANAAALTTSWGLPLIKPKPMDPLPVKFTGDLGVIDDELEIIDFVPAWEVCHAGHQVKQEPLERAPHFPCAASHHHPTEELQEQSDTPNPMMGQTCQTILHPPTLRLMTVNLPPQGQFYPPLLPPAVPPQSPLSFHRISLLLLLHQMSPGVQLLHHVQVGILFLFICFSCPPLIPLQMVLFFTLVLNLQVPPKHCSKPSVPGHLRVVSQGLT